MSMKKGLTLAVAFASACVWYDGLPSDGSGSSDAGTTTTTSGAESTSTGGASTGVADSTSEEDDSVGFVPAPEVGPPAFECDQWKNDCPRGEKCMPWANDGGAFNATKCTPIARDPNAPGESCTVVDNAVSGIDDCEAFAMCWDVDPRTNMGVCVAFCTGSKAAPVCEDPGTQCWIPGAGVLNLCLPFCDPLAQDCDEGSACYPNYGFGFECAPDVSGGAGAAGDPCEVINACDPGLFCADAASVPACRDDCCTPFCDLSAPACPLFTECVPWYEDGQAPPGYEDLGACMEGA